MPTIEVAAVDEGSTLKVLGHGFADTRVLLTKMGLVMVARAQQAFRDQRQYGGKPWLPRAVPNVAGIVADLAKGSTVKARRFVPRPALLDTGALRQSITYRVAGETVTVGSNLAYFDTHQDGGTSTQAITQTIRKNLARLLRQRPALREKLGFLFSLTVLVTRVPRRPIVGVTPQLRADLHEEIVRHILGLPGLAAT